MHRWLLPLLFLLISACAAPPPPQDRQLYEALGEREGIASIVEETLSNIADDARIVALFRDTDIGRLRDKLIEQVCAISGGPCTYTGDAMDTVHRDLDIDEAEFNAFVEDLRDAMDTLKVPKSAQNRLLARLAPMRDEII